MVEKRKVRTGQQMLSSVIPVGEPDGVKTQGKPIYYKSESTLYISNSLDRCNGGWLWSDLKEMAVRL